MQIYLDGVFLLNFLVDLLLILGTNRLTGFPQATGKAAAAAFLGGLYGAVCLIPGMRFLGNSFWRLVFLCLISIIAFGCSKSTWSRGAVFVLLSMALGGIASGAGAADFWAVCICAGLLWLLCRIGFRNRGIGQAYIPVELSWNDRTVKVLALKDTGNTLRDPMTGEQVLVCGADIGEELLGLPKDCFKKPADLVAAGMIPGLRLITYHAVGQPAGLMAALRIRNIKVNGVSRDRLVAFAPQEIGKGEVYRMLTGGTL